MSNRIVKTALVGLTTLLAFAAIAPSVPATAQEAIMLEAHGFVRMVQPGQPRQIEPPQRRGRQADEKQHASAE